MFTYIKRNFNYKRVASRRRVPTPMADAGQSPSNRARVLVQICAHIMYSFISFTSFVVFARVLVHPLEVAPAVHAQGDLQQAEDRDDRVAEVLVVLCCVLLFVCYHCHLIDVMLWRTCCPVGPMRRSSEREPREDVWFDGPCSMHMVLHHIDGYVLSCYAMIAWYSHAVGEPGYRVVAFIHGHWVTDNHLVTIHGHWVTDNHLSHWHSWSLSHWLAFIHGHWVTGHWVTDNQSLGSQRLDE